MRALWWTVGSRFKSRERLEAENLALWHQVTVRRRSARLRLRGSDRFLLVWLYRLWPSVLGAIVIVQPETAARWHRDGLKAFWRLKSRGTPGRPRVAKEIRDLIREVSRAQPSTSSSRCGQPTPSART